MRATIIMAALFLAGCTHMQEMMNRSVPDTRIHLGPRDGVIEFNAITRKDSAGTRIDEYTCINPYVMVCKRFGSTLYCECR